MDQRDEFYLPEEALEWLGLKKSEYLSKVIEISLPDDFGFEEYFKYDHLIPETLETADQILENKSDVYPIRTFIKSYFSHESYSQIVIGANIPDQNDTDVLVPILTLVTRSTEVIKAFSGDQVISKPQVN